MIEPPNTRRGPSGIHRGSCSFRAHLGMVIGRSCLSGVVPVWPAFHQLLPWGQRR